MNPTSQSLKADLNQQCGQLSWSELERHFARGAILKVTLELDLVDVAVVVTEDNRDTMAAWLEHGEVAPATDKDAKVWNEQNTLFRAVVVAPWVLVQECSEQ